MNTATAGTLPPAPQNKPWVWCRLPHFPRPNIQTKTQGTLKIMKKSALLVAFALLALTTACQTMSTQRVETDSVTDVGDKWNDTDSRLVADEMIDDVLSRPWLNRFYKENNGENPVVIIGSVKNKSHEHINVKTFVRNLERALLNSGQVEFVASRGERDEIRDERLDQASHASEETAKSAGQEIGADFMLKGELNSIVNKDGGKSVRFYQVDMTLIDLEKNKKVWIGEKQIKKVIKQSRFKF
ncbi:penicillin-binding protein activator lpob [Desulfoluna butyratoxydans]|uniref:Penicillin-binding protein activator lpob n=2 Tax=Desulfoluna butyratoxydans TaxID=231438 RepID=A0A4U8YUF6_9BACT|nr:penicillin-binding protein activator lpob [Desulfoluna butyratoxydans]